MDCSLRTLRWLGATATLAFACSSGGGGGSGSGAADAGSDPRQDPVSQETAAITGIRFDWSSYVQLAPGSDNWPLTWCDDDHQYTSWGDGGGFGGTNTDSRESLGFARITGSYDSFQTQNLWGGAGAVSQATFHGKVTSMLCLDGDLYAWRGPGSSEQSFDYKQLILSESKGIFWQEDAFPASRVDGCRGCPGLPYTINYGRNYMANADGYVYTYWIEIQDPTFWEVQKPGVLWLSRARVDGRAFTDAANWEWLIGFDRDDEPIWGRRDDRAAVLEEPRGLMRGSAIFVPGLQRFLMVQNHTARNQGKIVIWEAPRPWGPWSVVLDESTWPEDGDAPVPQQFAFGNFSPKWFSPDGRTGVFVWFQPDRWNSVAFELEVAP